MVRTQSLYDKIGGKQALTAVVDQFYTRVLADKKLAPLFAKTDMKKQRAHQFAFLAMALGGPNEYRGQAMRPAHAGRGITEEHFGLVAGHLQSTLEWAKVGKPEITAIMTAAASLKDEVVGH
jgi:hemoglobin